MKVRYVRVWRIHGANTIESDKPTLALTKISDPNISAFLTNDVGPYLFHQDRANAIATQLLKGVFAPDKEGTPEQRLTKEIEDIRASRSAKSVEGVFLVVECETEIPEPAVKNRKEMETFTIALDAVDKDAIRDQFLPHEQAILLALALSLGDGADRQIERLGDVVYLVHPEDGKPIYSFSFKGGTARTSLSSTLTEDIAQEASTLAKKLVGNKTMVKPTKLLVSSFDRSKDTLQAFVASWTALEIFVDATFKDTYEAQWFDIMKEGAPASARDAFKRLGDVMADKYTLAVKFIIIASVLNSDQAEADIQKFRELKKYRDGLFHALDDSKIFPTEKVQRLMLKYLKLHLN